MINENTKVSLTPVGILIVRICMYLEQYDKEAHTWFVEHYFGYDSVLSAEIIDNETKTS